MTNELLRTSSLSFFVSISYHTFPHLSSVSDNFFGKIFREFFIHQLCIIAHTHQVQWFKIFPSGRHSLGSCVILKSASIHYKKCPVYPSKKKGVVSKKRGRIVKRGGKGMYKYTMFVYIYAGMWVGHPPAFCVIAFSLFPCVSKHRLPPSFGLGGWACPSKKSPRCE